MKRGKKNDAAAPVLDYPSPESKAALQVIVLGSGGGPAEDDVTGLLVRSTATQWAKGSVLAVDAGTHLAAIASIVAQYHPTPAGIAAPTVADGASPPAEGSHYFPHDASRAAVEEQAEEEGEEEEEDEEEAAGRNNDTAAAAGHMRRRFQGASPFAGVKLPAGSARARAAYITRELVSTYLITHPHLDHISGFVINTASFQHTARPKRLAALSSTIDVIKTHIFNDAIWPNLSDEEGGVGLVSYMRLVEGGDVAIGEGDGRGYIEVCEGLGVKSWMISHGTRTTKRRQQSFPHHHHHHHHHHGSRHGSSIAASSASSLPHSAGYATLPADLEAFAHSAWRPSIDRSCVYDSTAYFIRDQASGREVLIFGDVEPDSISLHPRTAQVWSEAAPKIAAGMLSAIFIECSYDDSQSDATLFGHLAPRHLIEELRFLADRVMAIRSGGDGGFGGGGGGDSGSGDGGDGRGGGIAGGGGDMDDQRMMASTSGASYSTQRKRKRASGGGAAADTSDVGPKAAPAETGGEWAEAGGATDEGPSRRRLRSTNRPGQQQQQQQQPQPQPQKKTKQRPSTGSDDRRSRARSAKSPVKPAAPKQGKAPPARKKPSRSNSHAKATAAAVAAAAASQARRRPQKPLPLAGVRVVIIHMKDPLRANNPAPATSIGASILAQLEAYEREADSDSDYGDDDDNTDDVDLGNGEGEEGEDVGEDEDEEGHDGQVGGGGQSTGASGEAGENGEEDGYDDEEEVEGKEEGDGDGGKREYVSSRHRAPHPPAPSSLGSAAATTSRPRPHSRPRLTGPLPPTTTDTTASSSSSTRAATTTTTTTTTSTTTRRTKSRTGGGAGAARENPLPSLSSSASSQQRHPHYTYIKNNSNNNNSHGYISSGLSYSWTPPATNQNAAVTLAGALPAAAQQHQHQHQHQQPPQHSPQQQPGSGGVSTRRPSSLPPPPPPSLPPPPLPLPAAAAAGPRRRRLGCQFIISKPGDSIWL